MSDPRDRPEPAHVRADEDTVGGQPNLADDVAVAVEAYTGVAPTPSTAGPSPAFDDHHPPPSSVIDDCVHCGFCLPTCPTYLLFGEEMDSPRGRIYLMKEGLEGEPLTEAMVRHFDLCLGCLACVTACPSGVRYEQLIEATRQQVERRHRRPLADRLFRELLFSVLPYPWRLRVAAAGAVPYRLLGLRRLLGSALARRILPERLRTLNALLPEPPPKQPALPPVTRPIGRPRRRVAMLTGCVQRVFFPHVNAATARVLAAEGCEVVAPPGQGCCGALSLHAGREAEAIDFARRTIDEFERAGVDAVVVNVAGCGSAMKEYGHLLRDDPAYAERARRFSSNVLDVNELLASLDPEAERHPLRVVAAYHDACHLAHGQGVRRQPRDLLRGIPGLQLKEIRESEICCGSAGIYNLLEPEAARELGLRKARNVLAAGAEVLVTANPGCLMQIRASLIEVGEELPVYHPVEVLDASIRGQPLMPSPSLSSSSG